jgi:hypothetical protein
VSWTEIARDRQLHTGITTFAWAADTETLLCPIGDELYVMVGVGTPLVKLFDAAAVALPGPILDPRISADGTLVGFVCDKELYTCALDGGSTTPAAGAGAGVGHSASPSSTPRQLTTSARGTALTNGLADFIGARNGSLSTDQTVPLN